MIVATNIVKHLVEYNYHVPAQDGSHLVAVLKDSAQCLNL